MCQISLTLINVYFLNFRILTILLSRHPKSGAPLRSRLSQRHSELGEHKGLWQYRNASVVRPLLYSLCIGACQHTRKRRSAVTYMPGQIESAYSAWHHDVEKYHIDMASIRQRPERCLCV